MREISLQARNVNHTADYSAKRDEKNVATVSPMLARNIRSLSYAKAGALFLLARKRARGVYQVDFAIDLPACYQREREKERERVRLAEKSAKKYAPEPRDHTRAALKNDRSIDRQEHAVISMHDLLSRLSN